MVLYANQGWSVVNMKLKEYDLDELLEYMYN